MIFQTNTKSHPGITVLVPTARGGFFKPYQMTLLLITYEKSSDQLIATISEELELKVAYCSTTNTVSVIKKDKVLTTAEVKPKFPASSFIEYCFNTQKYFGL